MKLGFTATAIAAFLCLGTVASQVALSQQQQPAVPDAPTPQPMPPLSGVNGPITPGMGAGDVSPSATSSSDPGAQQQAPPSSLPPAAQAPDNFQTAPPEMPIGAEAVDAVGTRLRVEVNYVDLPVTVRDSKGHLVAGLTWRDFKVFENNTRENIAYFTVSPFPLSIAFVIDQSLTSDVMAKVNNSLGAIQGALAPYDEVAVFSYANGPQERTAFTGAQSARLPAVLALTRETGTDMQVPVNVGPLSGCNIRENGSCVDPNLQPGRSAGSGNGVITIPKEIHTLNDAILSAAKELSRRPPGHRRIIYVISDGKENGSRAPYKDVLRYLQTNEIAVYGTLVGDSARWGEGYISRVHIPFTMYENILYKYIAATGGTPDSENNLNGIEKSYAKIAEEARNQYTLGYYSKEPFIDGKYRKIDVRVNRPGLDVISKLGYYPSARDMH